MCLNIHTQPLACGKLAFKRSRRGGTSLGGQGILCLVLWACPSLFSRNHQIRLDFDSFDVQDTQKVRSTCFFIHVCCTILFSYHAGLLWQCITWRVYFRDDQQPLKVSLSVPTFKSFRLSRRAVLICDPLRLLSPNCLNLSDRLSHCSLDSRE